MKRWESLRRFFPFSLLFFPLLILAPALYGFPFPGNGSAYSDITISHYPYALVLRDALQAGYIPLWSPLILSGMPLAANPLSGLWYPPGWLAWILPLPLGFNLLIGAHLFWGGVGMARFLYLTGKKIPTALFGGMIFAALPRLFAHYGAGHLTLLYAVPWTPWLLISVEAARRTAISGRIRSRMFRPFSAIALALIFLADPRWAAFAGLLWFAYSLVRFPTRGFVRGSLCQLLFFVSQNLSLAALLAAPLIMPLFEYTRLSTRSEMQVSDFFTYSLPPARLLGLFFPDFSGFHEYALYAGSVTLLLALLAILWRTRDTLFWSLVVLVSLVFTLGENIPFLPFLANVPGFDLLRVPARALLITGLSLSVLAANGMDVLFEGLSPGQTRRGLLALAALTGFALFFTFAAWGATGQFSLPFTWGGGGMLLVTLWIGAGLKRRMSPAWLWAGLCALCVLDLWAVDSSMFTARTIDDVTRERTALAEAIAGQPGLFRTYSPSYSLPQEVAALYRVQLADGVDPLQLQAYSQFMESATGVPRDGYSVTLPAFSEGDPAVRNAAYIPNPSRLGLLNVRYVASEFDLDVDGFVLMEKFGQTRLYENLQARPRAWLQPEAADLGDSIQAVESISWLPEMIEIAARVPPDGKPAILVLSEINYPGWQVTVDGKGAELLAPGGLLRGVRLEEGLHQVVFQFFPISVYAGLFCFVLGVLGLVLTGYLSLRADARPRGKRLHLGETAG